MKTNLPSALVLLFSLAALATHIASAQEKPASEPKKEAVNSANDPVAVDAAKREELEANVGKTVTVTGQVLRTKDWDGGPQKKKKMNFIDLKPNLFGTVTWEEDYAAFGQNLPAAAYKGKKISVTGELQERQGKFQIILKTPDQVKVLEDEAKDGKQADKGSKDKAEKKDKEEPKAEKPDDAAADAATPDKKRVDSKKFFK
jgi:DNA/RNA endonuclease YhcR with UshA esterase domain